MKNETTTNGRVGDKMNSLVKWKERELKRLGTLTDTDTATSDYCLARTYHVLSI